MLYANLAIRNIHIHTGLDLLPWFLRFIWVLHINLAWEPCPLCPWHYFSEWLTNSVEVLCLPLQESLFNHLFARLRTLTCNFPFPDSWRRIGSSLLNITARYQWWACLHDSLQLWLWAACTDWGTDEGVDLPRGSCI